MGSVHLSADIIDAAKRGEAVPISADNENFVVLRADLYQKMQDDFDPSDAYPLINEVMREDDEHDPLLSQYQESE